MKTIVLFTLLFVCFSCEKRPEIIPFEEHLFHGHWVTGTNSPDDLGVYTYSPFDANSSLDGFLLFDGFELLEDNVLRKHSPVWDTFPVTSSTWEEGYWSYSPETNILDFDIPINSPFSGLSYTRLVVVDVNENELRVGLPK